MPSVSFYTLGCKLNFSESSTMAKQLADKGFERKEFQDAADLYVINTCSVTDHADRKCKKVVAEALRYNPNAYIVVVGCYAQLKPQEIAEIPGVDLVLGAAEKFQLIDYLHSLSKEEKARTYNRPIKETREFVPGFSEGDRTRSFLKVQDGCDYFCTFCTIPLARGRSRSANIADTVKRVQEAAASGAKEIVLTGVNLGDFGVGHGETFYELVQALDSVEGVERFRISSIEPNLLSNDIIEFVARSQKFVPHFHIPLQSGNDEILQRMRRKYLRETYASRVALIKERMPEACIGVDIIVGFPGESEAHFQDTFDFVHGLDVSYFHVFPYSERPNTTARKMADRVPLGVRQDRVTRLRNLSEKKRRQFAESQLGQTRQVLFEAEDRKGWMQGFTENYVKVQAPYDPLLVNTLSPVLLETLDAEATASGPIVAV
ncbi:MAG: tRNA (N(6)-L-threonylcarbamoyladenosine(37)-C(2))-methylthiotransferase MtaB [Bacteroidia bacterium]